MFETLTAKIRDQIYEIRFKNIQTLCNLSTGELHDIIHQCESSANSETFTTRVAAEVIKSSATAVLESRK